MEGWIKVHRKIIESEIWDKPPLYLKVWMYLLLKAQHGDYKQLKRGQLYTSIPEIQKACSWKSGYRTEKPSKDQVFQILSWMRTVLHGMDTEGVTGATTGATMITTTRATHGMLINIDNYCVYQGSEIDGSNAENDTGATTEKLREQRSPDNINKNVKNVKKKDKDQSSANAIDRSSYSQEFETFWNSYPRKVGKQRAYSLWMKRINYFKPQLRAGVADLIKSSQNYALYCEKEKVDKKYIKHPSTFLSDKLDYQDWVNWNPEEDHEPKKMDKEQDKIYRVKQGEWVNSGRGLETEEDLKQFEVWIKNGGNINDLYRQHDSGDTCRKSTDRFSAD